MVLARKGSNEQEKRKMKTLNELKKATQSKSGDGSKRKFLSLKDKDSFRIRFLQELTEDSKNFNEERGTALLVAIHVNPLNFRLKLACTAESEEHGFRCWACEQVASDSKWRSQQKCIINVAVQRDSGTWDVAVLEQGFGRSHIGNALVDNALEFGSIVDRTYRLSRSGSGFNDTMYSLLPLAESPESDDVKALDLFDFDGLYKQLPYEDQQEFFFPSEDKDPSKSW
jgi:hypothetical protein